MNSATPYKNIKLLYFYDALCGWCFGFGPVMSKIDKTFGGSIEIEVISGGLFLSKRVGMINEVAPYIKEGAYKSVENRTGVQFGKPFLKRIMEQGNMTMDSYPAAIALSIVKDLALVKGITFANWMSDAIYKDGMDPSVINNYALLAQETGYDMDLFIGKMKSKKYSLLAQKDFKRFNDQLSSGMPALVIQINGRSYPITSGFVEFEPLEDHLRKIISKFGIENGVKV